MTFKIMAYEQGLEDYEEAAQRVEQEQLQEQKVSRQQQLSGLARPFMTLFSVLGNALSSGRSMQVATGPDPSWLFRGILGAGRKGDDGQVGKSTSSDDDDAADNQNANSTALLVPAAAKEEGRYIKGDPLNGYYDFVISEGSYKFWAAFQVATAVLIIYSTFAAIYYSKVSPLTSDYDYIDYLNGGRSFAGGRSTMVGPAPAASARGDHGSLSWQDRMLDKPWFNMAAQSFAFVMEAIERAPK
ncbi:hypothetical protein quinque_016063 [Culex quinquefasciatus]